MTNMRLSYLPALDGLRALAVIAVLLYHAEVPWVGGGFLGVEVFFVLSGYLITSLLLSEWLQSGCIDLRAFWLRRARRLLPALFLLLAGTLTYAVLFLPDEVAGLRDDALAAMAYVTNWYLVFSQQSYFEAMSRPSLLQHLWSLAVEEQFYLLWPLLIAGGLRVLRTPLRMMVVVLTGAAASVGLMALLYQPDADASRIYYGTDTRAAGLLIGSALALAWLPRRRAASPSPGRSPGLLVDLVGLAALGGLIWAPLQLDETQPFLYQGGIALTAILTASVIAAATHDRAAIMPRLLGWGPLRWIGLRSYGIYLWHWPVFSVTRPELDVPLEGAPLLALRLAATIALAEVSYRFVEMPVRAGSIGRSWRLLREARGAQRRLMGARWAIASGSTALLAVVLGVSLVEARPPAVPDYLAASDVSITFGPVHLPHEVSISATERSEIEPGEMIAQASATPESIGTGEVDADEPLAPMTLLGLTPTVQPSLTPSVALPSPTLTLASPTLAPSATPTIHPSPSATPQPASPTPSPVPPTATVVVATPQPSSFIYGTPPARVERITAIGDSVMIGAVPEMRRVFGNIDVDAAKSRQVSGGISLLRAWIASDKVGDVLVIHLGNNGYFTAAQFDQIMQLAGSERTVVFLNNKVPRRWEGPNNAVLADRVKHYPNAILIDWRSAIMHQPGSLARDGIHLGSGGARLYVKLIAVSLGK